MKVFSHIKHIPASLAFLLLIANSTSAQLSGLSVVESSRRQIGVTLGYDSTYRQLDYPGGDVPIRTGVCTDVIIRSYRALGIDLQELVHEDMARHFEEYPSKRIWGLTRTDKNIDHRRVPNLEIFFKRHGSSFPIAEALSNAQAGDMLTWQLPSGVPHIGFVSDKRSHDGKRPLIVHNIGEGTVEEDMAGEFKITGWYRFSNLRPQ